jgi:hypothetical protein
MHTITTDFIVGLPEVLAAVTPWQIKGFETYNALMTVTNKSLKQTLLILGHNTYTVAN